MFKKNHNFFVVVKLSQYCDFSGSQKQICHKFEFWTQNYAFSKTVTLCYETAGRSALKTRCRK